MRSDPGQAGPSGLVFNVQRASFHDGPGIRTTVFLKGCPLACPWCHNPESLSSRPEVSVNTGRCLSCGACREACPRPGGPLAAGAALGSDGCADCGACFDACPTAARGRVGREWSVAELAAEALRDRGAYEASGGGVTFSGGEPLAQPAFVVACLDSLRAAGIHTAVDTCGLAPRATVLEVAARTDLLLWDVKHLDPGRHWGLTGAPLAPILDNLAAAAEVGVPIWLRVPLVAGINDSRANLAAVASLAAATPNVRKISLLPYHATGTAKLGRLGRGAPAMAFAPPTPDRVAELRMLLAPAGVETTVGA